eukprot:1763450-Amphidinium_carterae.1
MTSLIAHAPLEQNVLSNWGSTQCAVLSGVHSSMDRAIETENLLRQLGKVKHVLREGQNVFSAHVVRV